MEYFNITYEDIIDLIFKTNKDIIMRLQDIPYIL